MKKTLIALLLGISFQGFGQDECKFSEHYPDFISIEKTTQNEKSYLIKRVVETNSKSCLSSFVNNNISFIDYLLTNFSSNSNYPTILQMTDSVEIRNTFLNDLKTDSMFNSVMSELVSKSIDKTVAKDTVTMDQLLNVAVKYFSIMRLTREGYYMGKVCVGLNDIKKTEANRNPFMEAFSFSSILKNYQGEEFNMHNEFVKALQDLYKVNLGLDKDEKLLRAQGAMFFLMRKNENLKKMLLSEYEKQKDSLPFVLVD